MLRFAPPDQLRSVILRFRIQIVRSLSLIYKQKIFKITPQNRNVEAHNLKNCSSDLKFLSAELQLTSTGPQPLQFGTRVDERVNCKIRGWDSNPAGEAYPPPRGLGRRRAFNRQGRASLLEETTSRPRVA